MYGNEIHIVRHMDVFALFSFFGREARITLIKMHVADTPSSLSAQDLCMLGERTEGFSGSDLSNCTSDAMFEPVRELEANMHWKLNHGMKHLQHHIEELSGKRT